MQTHAATAVHEGDEPPEGCEVPVKEAPVEPTFSLFALSGPGRQTSTWITETLTLTGNGSKKGTAEFRWGYESVRESNSPRQFPFKCSRTRPINSNWKGTTTVIKSFRCLVCKLWYLVLTLILEHNYCWDMTLSAAAVLPWYVMFKFNNLNFDHIWTLKSNLMCAFIVGLHD